jgi:acyl-CoA thioesterase-1
VIAFIRASFVRIVRPVMVVAALALAGAPVVVTAADGGDRTLLVLGDSISAAYGIAPEEGWVNLLARRLDDEAPGVRVVNASVSGETTGGGLARLPGALDRHAPDYVVIELGGNDGLRGYPIDRIRANLDRMVSLALDAGAEVLLVGMMIPPNYGERYMNAFHGTFHTVAQTHDVPLVPFLLDGVATAEDLMQDDGIHPTAEAQPMLLDNLWPAVAELLTAGTTTAGTATAPAGG